MASPFPTNEAREADRLRKREALLVAAVRMFNDRGFHATSLDDVAASLGVTKPVIYHHLGNKDQVLFECVAVGLAQLRAAAQAARAGGGTGYQRLHAFLCAYAEVTMTGFGRCVIRTGEELLSPASRDRFVAMKRGINGELRRMVDEAVADGSAEVADPHLATFVLAGALNWPARWYREDGPDTPATLAGAMVDQLLRGVLPAVTPARTP